MLPVSGAVGSGLRNAETCSIISLYPDFLAKSETPLYPLDALRLAMLNPTERFSKIIPWQQHHNANIGWFLNKSLKLTLCSHKHERELSLIPLSFLCLTSGNSGSDCVNRSVADRGSRAMIGLRSCAFSCDFKVTKIYNHMAYDTLVKSHPKLMTGKENEPATLEGSAWPHTGVHY